MNDAQDSDDMVNAVVDNLADKLGVAVDTLQPIAETAIAETSRLGAAYFAVGVLCVLATVCVAAATLKCCRRKGVEDLMGYTMPGCLLVMAFGFMAYCAINAGLSRWLAPTLHLIEKALRG